MNVVSYPRELAVLGRPVVIALGVFDGMHCGHQAVIREELRLAQAHGAIPAVLYFSPHPKSVLSNGVDAPLWICTEAERFELLAELGIDHVVRFPFTRELAGMTAKAFFDAFLNVPGLTVSGFCVGTQWRFGKGNTGTGEDLKKLAAQIGAETRLVPEVYLDGAVVSSTRIRQALQQGDMPTVRAMLGRPYCVRGCVERGQGIGGAVLSYPTANLGAEHVGMQLPRFGVYSARAHTKDNEVFNGIVYVGDAPTLRGHTVVVEMHLFDYIGDLYDKDIRIEFVSFLRDSIAFASVDALKAQIEQDIQRAKASFLE